MVRRKPVDLSNSPAIRAIEDWRAGRIYGGDDVLSRTLFSRSETAAREEHAIEPDDNNGLALGSAAYPPVHTPQSSRVVAYQWYTPDQNDPDNGQIFVRFKNARGSHSTLYSYNASYSDYLMLDSADSKGKHINSHLNNLGYDDTGGVGPRGITI